MTPRSFAIVVLLCLCRSQSELGRLSAQDRHLAGDWPSLDPGNFAPDRAGPDQDGSLIAEVSMRDVMRSAAWPKRRSCSGDRTSRTSDRTWATCAGAASASAWKPGPVRMAWVNRRYA